jgi:hypothetical protein
LILSCRSFRFRIFLETLSVGAATAEVVADAAAAPSWLLRRRPKAPAPPPCAVEVANADVGGAVCGVLAARFAILSTSHALSAKRSPYMTCAFAHSYSLFFERFVMGHKWKPMGMILPRGLFFFFLLN